MLTCDELKPLIHAYLDGELDLMRSLDLERHLEECAACAADMLDLRELRRELQEPELYHRPGPELRERILASLPKESGTELSRRLNRRPPAVIVVWAVAASVAFVAVSIWAFVRLGSDSGEAILERAVVAGHVRSLMAKHLVDVESSDRHTVKPWFHGQLDFAPPVPEPAGFALIGGRLDYLDNHKAAAVVYKRDKHIINLFIWPDNGARDELSHTATRQGYQLLHWSRSGFNYWAISDLSAEGLREFAELVMR